MLNRKTAIFSLGRKDVDVCFVLPGWTFGYPPGGYDIVYQLASRLARDRTNVVIIFMEKRHEYLYRKTSDETFISGLKWKDRLVSSPNLFSRFLISLYWKLRGVDYDYSLLKDVRCRGSEDPALAPSSKIIIATHWHTAYYVTDYLSTHRPNSSYYLIQNTEDDLSFSGNTSKYATATYQFPLKKIVINDVLLARFRKDNPLFLQVGYDSDYFFVSRTIEDRSPYSILFPLRKGEFKGAQHALTALGILHQEMPSLTLSAFGDLERSKIPEFVNYAFLPTRSKLREMYNNSAIFVLPSLVEGFPIPPLEAMACGACVVATNSGGQTDYVIDNLTGLTIPAGNSYAIKEAVKKLATSNELRVKLARNGGEIVKKYTYSNMYEQFKDILNSV